ncbi:MAG TPA: hypothetical protein VJJ82_02180 [Candidatus Nanoarchaeia archaeon]|nr:hypothetical protein [Candidatus Nanoarchaeia archaeon]
MKSKPLEQIESLFAQALANKQKAQKHIALARKLAAKSRMHLPARLSKLYCKSCNSLLNKTRIRNKTIVRVCGTCGFVRRKKTVIKA